MLFCTRISLLKNMCIIFFTDFFYRYYVIVHPLKAQYLCTMSKAKKTVVITWILAFLLAIPIIVVQVSFFTHKICHVIIFSPKNYKILKKQYLLRIYLHHIIVFFKVDYLISQNIFCSMKMKEGYNLCFMKRYTYIMVTTNVMVVF